MTGFGIKGDVLSIEDTFSLLAGREIRLNGLVELSSLMLCAGWGMRTVNMPSVHAIVCGSVLNKVVSQADERWGVRWTELAPSLRVYALGDLKHGWLVYTTIIGILIRGLFPDPESALYLCDATQEDFVRAFNVLIIEALVGTELHQNVLDTASTRETLLKSLRYRLGNGELSDTPPARVELLVELLSPWPNVTYGGCRFLRTARADTIRKFKAMRAYFDNNPDDIIAYTILNVDVTDLQKEYVLFGLTAMDCRVQGGKPIRAAPLRGGWADQPDHPVRVLDLPYTASIDDWLKWAHNYNRRVRPAMMEWILMDPSRVPKFVENLNCCVAFARSFPGYFSR